MRYYLSGVLMPFILLTLAIQGLVPALIVLAYAVIYQQVTEVALVIQR